MNNGEGGKGVGKEKYSDLHRISITDEQEINTKYPNQDGSCDLTHLITTAIFLWFFSGSQGSLELNHLFQLLREGMEDMVDGSFSRMASPG